MFESSNFLELSYTELEALNLQAKEERLSRVAIDTMQERRIKYLADTARVRVVTVCFTDLEGRLHMLDYDKKFILKGADNLTFDGSSIRGFSVQHESDLRLKIDWSAFYWVPSDVFGAGKVLVFAEVCTRSGEPFAADMRAQLRLFTEKILKESGNVLYAAHEVEGFLFKGRDAEKQYLQTGSFEFASTGGYYHALPADPMKQFIDWSTDAQRAMGFENEKNHPEVAPSQFEINYSYTEILIAADTVQLYKLLCRQIADHMGMTASFLPKPVTGINGSGMHTNISVGNGNKNLFYDKVDKDALSAMGWDFINRILSHANDICLVLNSSVNAYRRLDPHYEAPNQIKVSALDRGSMIRIPAGNERSTRIEVRSVGPDANPYMLMYVLARTGLEGKVSKDSSFVIPGCNPGSIPKQFLPDNIYDAIDLFQQSSWIKEILTEPVRCKFVDLKLAQAHRCPRLLGSCIKQSEIQYHHEITNQFLWGKF